MKIRNIDLEKDAEKILKLDIEKAKDLLRRPRDTYLKAYDTYIANVVYTAISETPQQKAEILDWKAKVLDLDNIVVATNAIKNTPPIIRYFAGEKVIL